MTTQNLILLGIVAAVYVFRNGLPNLGGLLGSFRPKPREAGVPQPIAPAPMPGNAIDHMDSDTLGRAFALAIQREARHELADKLSAKAREEIRAAYLGAEAEGPKGDAGS